MFPCEVRGSQKPVKYPHKAVVSSNFYENIHKLSRFFRHTVPALLTEIALDPDKTADITNHRRSIDLRQGA
ncbi:MAG: hypothetical protein Q7U44_12115, partial [Desulfuromonadales bacterium]|nr:hypothetical protein [Desulfuromonadales bacterium]